MTATLTIPRMSNPRSEALVPDWPIGRSRCKALFRVTADKRGLERVMRWTENKARTGWNQPRATVYGSKAAIVDGDDGRTYLLIQMRNSIAVWSGDMKTLIAYLREQFISSDGQVDLGDPEYLDARQLLASRV